MIENKDMYQSENINLWSGHSAGKALRQELFSKIKPILSLTESIDDSNTRLVVQASCLDMVTALEEVIEQYELDRFPASVAC